MYKQYKEQYLQMKEMEGKQIKNKYLHAAIIKLKDILKKIDIDVDIPTQNYLDFFKWIAKKAIWAAILLFFSILTIIGCLDLLLQYISGETTTTIDVSKDRQLSFPTSTVCLPMYAVDFYKLDENFNMENASQYLHAEVSEYFENQSHNKKIFLYGSSWTPAILSVVYKYLSHLTFIENNEWTIDTELNFSEYKIELQRKDWWKAASTLEKEITMLNISISELTEAVGQAIAIKFNLGVTSYTTYDGMMNSSYFSYSTRFIGSSWICYNVDFSGLVITSKDVTIVVEVNATSLDIALKYDSDYRVLFAPSADFHMDLKILASNDSDDLPLIAAYHNHMRKNYYLAYIGDDRYVSYDLIQVYRFMTIINGRQQCSEVQSTEVCRTQCRASMIKNLCKCTATSLTTLEDMSSECTLTTYGNCSAYDANNDLICDCLKPCTRWDYEVRELTYYDSESYYSGRIIIRLAKFDYRIFEQTYLWKMEGFIGAFGGALSLWLGIDFLMAINFFSVVVAKLIEIGMKSKQPSSSTAIINRGHTSLKEQDDAQKGNQVVGKNEIEKTIAGDELLAIKAIKPSNWSCYEILSFVVNLLFSIATVILCIVLIHKYFSDPPVIEMSVPYDETFELPQLTEIILPMININLTLHIDESLYGKKVDEYFGQQQMNKETFLSPTAEWPLEIFVLSFNYLACLSAVEGTELDYWDTMNFSKQQCYVNYYFTWKPYSDKLYDGIFQLENKLSQIEVTIKELKLAVAEKIKSAFQLSVTYVYAVDGVVTKENISIIENTCINQYRVCFKADFSNKPMRRSGDYFEVSSIINESILPIHYEYEKKALLRVDFLGRIMKFVHDWTDNFAIMEGTYGFSTAFKVFTIDAYRKIPSVKGETQCMSYEKNDQCRWQCRSEMIYKKCNCTTTSLPLPSLPFGPECSFSIYNKCLQYSKQDDMQCIKQCLEPCEKWKYQVDMEKQIHLEGENEAIIKIQVKKFDYVMYVEKLPWGYETFAGAIGGALGLWLGLDFVIMIDAISELIGSILARLLRTVRLKKINARATVPDRVQSNEASKKHQEERNVLIFTSDIMTWSTKSFKMLIKALYSMKLGVILKQIVVMTFWGYLIVLFSFLTFRMCLLSTKQYLTKPTTMNMQFSLSNTFNMPTSTLCVPVNPYTLDDMVDFGAETNYESMMMEYFARNQENKEAFLNATDKKWPSNIYAVVHEYLYLFNKAEGYMWKLNEPCPMELVASRSCPDFHLWENNWKAIFKLEMILKQMNVSRSELLQSFGQQTLMIYDISILHIAEEKLIGTPIEIRETLSVDYEVGVCFKINFSGAAIRSEVEQFYISIDSNGLHKECIQYWITFDMYGNYWPADKIYETFYGSFEVRRTYIIGAKEFDQIFPGKKEDPDCSENVSPDICRSESRATLIRRLCNCTAASLPIREVSAVSDECTLAAYQNCLKYYAGDDFECQKNCLRSCKRETYQWSFDSSYFNEDWNYNKAILLLRVEQFGYATFEEKYEWGFVTFLGEFGGNLGLWMGLDIKMVLGELFSIVFVIGKQLMAFISAKIAENAVIAI